MKLLYIRIEEIPNDFACLDTLIQKRGIIKIIYIYYIIIPQIEPRGKDDHSCG